MSNVTVTLTDAHYSQLVLTLGTHKRDVTAKIEALETKGKTTMKGLTEDEKQELANLRWERHSIEQLTDTIRKGTVLG